MLGPKKLVTIILILTLILAINASSIAQPKPTPAVGQSSRPENVCNVDFCEIVKEPHRFFNQTIRVTAKWDRGTEFWSLMDDRCPSGLRQKIAARILDNRAEAANVQKLLSREYGGRAIITAVGTLRDPGKYRGYYRYRFEILRVEDVQHVVTPYDGTVEAGHTYRAVVSGDKDFGLRLVPQVRIEFHYSYRIEWINLSEFPVLRKLRETSGERTIVFSVISSERRQTTERRWNRSLEMKIIRVE